jgi:small subunit ribosomal protein S2
MSRALARRHADQLPHHSRQRLNRLEELEKLWATGQIETYSKKMKSTLQREMDKIKTNLEGIRKMEKMPGVMFIIDTRREHIAVKEARKLGVPTIALIDTDSDPDLIDLPIPGNDDAMRAIEIICQQLADSIIEGKTGRVDKADGEPVNGTAPRRRSSRAAFRADEGKEGEEPAVEEVAPVATATVTAPVSEPVTA